MTEVRRESEIEARVGRDHAFEKLTDIYNSTSTQSLQRSQIQCVIRQRSLTTDFHAVYKRIGAIGLFMLSYSPSDLARWGYLGS